MARRKGGASSGQPVTALIEHLVDAVQQLEPELAAKAIEIIATGGQSRMPGFESPFFKDEEIERGLRSLRIAAKARNVPFNEVVSAFGLFPELGTIARALADPEPRAALASINPVPFKPIIPSRVRRFFSPEDMWQRAGGGEWLVEPKFDGWECQIHTDDGQVRFFGRSRREFTHVTENLSEDVSRLVGRRKVILESEILATDPLNGRLLPHSDILKPEIRHLAVVFDVIFLDSACVNLVCLERRELLKSLFGGQDLVSLRLVEQRRASDFEAVASNFREFTLQGFEGMIAKRPGVAYEAYQRTANRIKVKEKDTVDAVILGYTTSTRSLLAAIWDDQEDEFVPFVWLAVSEDTLNALEPFKDFSLAPIISGDRKTDVQLRPVQVVEVEGDHIFPSKNFKCGYKQTGQGWSLYAASLLGMRSDKSPTEATTVEEFLDLPTMAGHSKPVFLRG